MKKILTKSKEKLSSLLTLIKNNPVKAALLGGLLLGLAFPPFPFPFLALVGFIVPITLAKHHKFKHLYLFFLVFNLITTYWLMLTALSAPNMSEAILSLTAGVVAIVVNSLLMALTLWLYKKTLKKFPENISYLLLIAYWIIFEYIHLHWELAWPWLTLGHSFAYIPFYVQYIKFTGILGVSLFILAVNLLIYKYLQNANPKMLKILGISLLVPLIFIPDFNPEKPSGYLNVRIIQPNIDPYQKFEKLTIEEQVLRIVNLIEKPGIDTIDVVLLPETAIPSAYEKEQLLHAGTLEPLIKLLDKHKKLNIVGGFTEFLIFKDKETAPSTAREFNGGWYEVANSAFSITNKKKIYSYQKSKLVPMVERVPYLEYLTFMKSWNIDLGGGLGNLYKTDTPKNMIVNDSIQIATVVCYESVFGDYVRKFVKKGASLLAIVTNDGWWKKSSGHIQHFRFATFRAIETNRFIVRSANTGISAIFDNKGNALQKTNYDEKTHLDGKVPLLNDTTIYVLLGDYLGIFSIIFVILLFAIKLWKSKKF